MPSRIFSQVQNVIKTTRGHNIGSVIGIGQYRLKNIGILVNFYIGATLNDSNLVFYLK